MGSAEGDDAVTLALQFSDHPMPDRGVGEGAVDEHHGWLAGRCGCIRGFPFPFGSGNGRGGVWSGGCFRWLAGDLGDGGCGDGLVLFRSAADDAERAGDGPPAVIGTPPRMLVSRPPVAAASGRARSSPIQPAGSLSRIRPVALRREPAAQPSCGTAGDRDDSTEYLVGLSQAEPCGRQTREHRGNGE